MTRSGGKAGPVPDNGTVDGAPGGRRVPSPRDSRVSPDARRVRTTPAKEGLTSPLAPSRRSIPRWGIRKKGSRRVPRRSKNRDGGALPFLIPLLKGEGGERSEPGGV